MFLYGDGSREYVAVLEAIQAGGDHTPDGKIAINEDLVAITNRAAYTRTILKPNGDKITENLKRARDMASVIKNDTIAIYLLEEILKMLSEEEKISTKNSDSAVAKKETSYQYVKRIRNNLITEIAGDKKFVKKTLADNRIMPTAVYSNRSKLTKDSIETLTRLYSEVMRTSSSKGKDVWYSAGKAGCERAFRDIVDASLYFSIYKQLLSTERFQDLLNVRYNKVTDTQVDENGISVKKTLEEVLNDIDSKYSGLVPGKDLSKLRDLYKLKFKYLKSVMVFNSIIKYLENGKYSDIVYKMKKEVGAFNECISEIQHQIDDLIKKLDASKEKAEKPQPIDNMAEYKSSAKVASKKGYSLGFKKHISDDTQKEEKVMTEEEKYAVYVKIRDELDRIVKRNIGKGDKAFRKDVVRNLGWIVGDSGGSYKDIILIIRSMRASLPVTSAMETFVNLGTSSVKFSINELFADSSSGLTKYEENLLNILNEVIKNPKTSPEMRAEAKYYCNKINEFGKTFNTNDPVWNCMGLSERRAKFYINTFLIDTFGINNKLLPGKKHHSR